ncbi:DUF4434 domain-containing protein [Nonomuraea sp. NPDC049486]|uniref:DUF4434 domain-containing protein n=1 Tax=Nonomuraea sp. NPDC049486 TaxID=3155773 RepID=UPI00343392DC
MLQRILRMAVAVTVVVLALVPDSLVGRVAGAGPGECPPRDTRVLARYPITGYWMIPRSDACVTRRMVEAIHGVGADTLITFGARLLPASVGPDGRVGGAFDDCVEDGRTCYQAARDTGRTIRQVYTYTASEHFGAGVLRCPGLDRRIENGGRVYYRLMLGDSCEASTYDLLLVAADGDGVGHMMTEAAAQGMKVFPGLPVPPKDGAKPWLPDLAHLPALNAFTARVVADYRQRYGASPALGGLYQSFELAMRGRAGDDPIIALYAAQHEVVAGAWPGVTIMVSPFWDARRGRGFPPEQVEKGFDEIAATRAGAPMVIAIQDGRGVGKVPVHGPDEADAPVDPRLEPVTGKVTNRQAYYGSARDYIEAAARRVTPGVRLWVNVEVFEPTQVAGECGRADPFPLRGRTTKARVDEQVAAAAAHGTKIIAYGWDPFLTCRDDPSAPSLADELAAGWQEPIVARATPAVRDGVVGVLVEGYHLGGGTLRFAYHRAGSGPVTVEAPQEWHDPGTGRGIPLESAWAAFEPEDPDPARPWVTITATNGAGHTATSGYAMAVSP